MLQNNLNDIQPFLDNPQELISQSIEVQLAVANKSATPRELLELLVASENLEVARAAQNHVNWAGELTEDCHLEAEKLLRNTNLGQNDRLAVELLKFAPVPEWFLSEWVPHHRLCLSGNYLPRRWRVQFLERLAREPSVEARLRAAESPDTPVSILEELAGDLELPLRVAVRYNPNCPTETIAEVESQQAIASNWETDAQQLAELAESRWSWVRLAVARNPSAPGEVLEKLAESDFYLIRLAIARNPSSPTAALEKLMESDRVSPGRDLTLRWEDKSILLALARHPNASERILLELLPRYREAIAHRTELPLSVIEKLIEKPPFYRSLLNLQNLTAAVLERILDRAGSYYYDSSIAERPQASASLLERLAENGSEYMRLAVAGNPNAPQELRIRLLEELVADSEENIKRAIARDPKTPVYLLERLAPEITYDGMGTQIERYLGETSPSLRQSIEELVATSGPSELIFWLEQDEVFRESILRSWERVRQNLSAEQLRILGGACDWLRGLRLQQPPELLPLYGLLALLSKALESEELCILQALAGNPSTPVKILETLGQVYPHSKEGNSILTALARNPKAPQKILEILGRLDPNIFYPHWWVRINLGNNPAVPEARRIEYLEEAIALDDRHFKEAIAINPNTPAIILEKLAERVPTKLSYIAGNPNAPVSLLERAAEEAGSDSTWERLAKNPRTPPELLELVALKADSRVREALFKHPALEPRAVYRIELKLEEQKQYQQDRQKMLRRSDSPYALAQLAEDGDRDFRFYAARNSKTPVSVLEQLAKDPVEGVRLELAQNPSLPLNLRLKLTDDLSSRVRMELARELYRQKTPAEVLERLAADSSESVRELVAQNPETPSSVLGNLADDNARKVRLAVAKNLKTPASSLRAIARKNPELKEKMLWRKPSGNEESDRFLVELIEEFASSADDSIRYKIAGHPKTPISILERLAFDEHKLVRLDVAQHPNTPPRLLIQMTSRDRVTTASGCAHTVSHAIAERSDAPAEALDFIARQPVDWIRAMALGNANTSAETLARSASSESDEWLLCQLAKHPNLSDEVALQVYRRENQAVRQSLASNSRLGASILEAIASDGAAEVRQQVGANSNAPVNLLEILAGDSVAEVRAAVAANANAPEHILEGLAADDKIEVRRAVAKNPATPQPVLDSLRDLLPPPLDLELRPTLRALGRLYRKETDDLPSLLSEYARSPKPFVRFVALSHPLTPAETLRGGSESLWWWERYAVADNPATPTEIREPLMEDSDRIVRATARLTIDN
ncbi:MAG: hypothetical protein SXA11_11765 [Cyanobacteriota bacterium]|nr:hypothetical protein [Cyanobacteriota bacterium]